MSVFLSDPQVVSSIIIATTILITIYLLAFIFLRIWKEVRATNQLKMKLELDQREFFSKLGNDRDTTERRLNEINRQLHSSQQKFQNVYHLLLEAQSKSNSNTEHSNSKEFLSKLNLNQNHTVDEKLVFVLTPFSSDEISTYAVISDTVQSVGLKCIRGDETHIEGEILRHIVSQILQARIVIANLNGRNPNVMYELGIAHALGKEVIVTAHLRDKLPFDLQSYQAVLYHNKTQLKDNLKTALARISFSH